MIWYADDSQFYSDRGAAMPDIYLFGGIIIDPENEVELRTRIESVKAKFVDPRAPVKWNVRDLEKAYEWVHENYPSVDARASYQIVRDNSKEIRERIFSEANSIEFAILLACVRSQSTKKKGLKREREVLTRYAFNNGLMRFGRHVADEGVQGAKVIMDWPAGNDRKPFDQEYADAYVYGRSCAGVTYDCGRLADLGFNDFVLVGNTNHSTILQFSDLVVGATKDAIECAVGKKSSAFGIDCLSQVKEKFRGYPNRVIGRGISVSTDAPDLRKAIESGFRAHDLI